MSYVLSGPPDERLRYPDRTRWSFHDCCCSHRSIDFADWLWMTKKRRCARDCDWRRMRCLEIHLRWTINENTSKFEKFGFGLIKWRILPTTLAFQEHFLMFNVSYRWQSKSGSTPVHRFQMLPQSISYWCGHVPIGEDAVSTSGALVACWSCVGWQLRSVSATIKMTQNIKIGQNRW